MKCLVFSDSHRNTRNMREALLRNPDAEVVFFLGDGLSDADLETMDSVFQNVISAVTLILDGKIDDAMTKYSK